jgi:hypothetical protein
MSRNLFDLDNARYLNKKELVETFIPTEPFNRILSPKNQIIIGSRGSGKTALLKMISHDHLSLFNNAQAQEVIKSKTYIGIHISTKTKFIGGLKNKDWNDETTKEKNFRWLMNIASCVALLETIKSCLSTYYTDTTERRQKELEVISKISEHWFSKEDALFSIADVAEKLEDIVTLKSKSMLIEKIYGVDEKAAPIGLTFDLELFEPLISAIKVVNRKLEFPDETSWFICIDEIEILDELHHKILNSYMRANMGNIFFKFTTLPYCHYTLETNTNVPLDIRHDVHYVYIDQDVSFNYRSKPDNNLAQQLFKARATISKPQFAGYSLQQLFGSSVLLSSRTINYDKIKEYKTVDILSDSQLNEVIKSDPVLSLFDQHSNAKTREKGRELLRNKQIKKFGDEIGRKMRGLLILKDYELSIKGKQKVELYSGAKTVVNVADANPRKLLGIFNSMLIRVENSLEFKQKQNKFFHPFADDPIISAADQNYVLASIADRELNRYRIEKNFGGSLYEFIVGLGEYMHDQIHKSLINTEQISSVEYMATNEEFTWKIIERAVQKGLIYPNINVNNPDEMPYKEGIFHLAFIFAPKFKLLPRKGDSKNLSSIMTSKQLTIKFDA